MTILTNKGKKKRSLRCSVSEIVLVIGWHFDGVWLIWRLYALGWGGVNGFGGAIGCGAGGGGAAGRGWVVGGIP